MIVDVECDSPTEQVKQATIALLRAGGGFVHRGYFNRFGPQWAKMFGISHDEFRQQTDELGLIEMAVRVAEKYLEQTMTEQEFIQMLDVCGVGVACIGTTGMWASLEDTAEFAARYPDRLLAFYRSNPHQGMKDVFAFEKAVRDLNLRGLVVSGFRENLTSSDRKYYPYYAKCVELNVPVRVTTSIHLYTDRPIDLCHPRYVDEIACDFPELTIIAGLGGWPWVDELVAVANRHPNVLIDLSCQRPKSAARSGSGFEGLLVQANRGLQDQFLFASGWGTQGLALGQIIEETTALAISDTVLDKWMYSNAARALGLAS